MTLRQDQQQPLTRRQLREMERAAQEAPTETGEQQVPPVALPFAAAPVVAVPAPVEEAPLPPAPEAPAAAQQAAPVVPLTRRQLRELQQTEENRQAPITEAPVEAEPLTRAPAAPVAAAPITEVPISALPLPVASAPVAAPISEAPVPAAQAAQPATPEVIDEAPLTTNTGQVRAYQPPTGHWSLGASESFDDVVSAGVEDAHLRSIDSTGSATGSMLVVPVVPSAADMTGPLNATGEILLTGSIDLPRGLGSTGQVEGHFDGSDIDRMLDQHDRDTRPDSGVAPVAATRAISTHAPSAAPNIVPPKKTSHKVGAVVGSVIGGVALLGVAGVVVAGVVFHAF